MQQREITSRSRRGKDGLQLVEHLDHIGIQALRAAHIGKHSHLLSKASIKRLGYLLGLADAAALDDDVVKLLQLGQADQLLEQVSAQGAADATILKRNDLFVRLGESVSLLDERSINVDAFKWSA